MDTGRKILNLRLDKKISQKKLANICKITPGALSKIETGSNKPSAEVLLKLSQALETSIDYLLDKAAPFPPPQASFVADQPGEDPNDMVQKTLSRKEYQFVKKLRAIGLYWSEAAFAIPSATNNTIRLVRFLLQRDQMTGANEAQKKAKQISRLRSKLNAKKASTSTPTGKKKKKKAKKRGRLPGRKP